MEDKYVIFCKHDPNRPISLIDKLMNSHVMELLEDEAIKYVNEKNKQYGEGFYWCEKISDWQKRLLAPQMQSYYEKSDDITCEIYEQLMGIPKIKEAIEKDYSDKDKNINGFQIPFVADNNEDYEKNLKRNYLLLKRR